MIARALGLETRKVPSDFTWRRLLGTWGGLPTESGVQVSEASALGLSTVYACVRFLSFNVAALPLVLYQKTGESERRRATDHPTFEVLHRLANPRTTAFQARAFIMASLLTRGNGLAFVERDGRGRALRLWPVRWDHVNVRRDEQTRRLVYEWNPSSSQGARWTEGQVWHSTGLSQDGVLGVSPIAACSEAIGSAIAARDFASRYWRNGGTPSGVLTHPTALGRTPDEREAAASRLRGRWEELYSGVEGAHRVAILEEDMKFTKISLDPAATQVLESRKFSRTEIASIFAIPAHLVGDLERATFGNIEQQSLEFVIYHLMPTLVALEQTIERDLLSEQDRAQGYYVKHNVEGLLRGDSTARANFYRAAIQTPWMTPNEIRALDELPPLEGGDELRFPLNVSTEPGGDPATSTPPGELPALPPPRRALPAPAAPEPDEELERRAAQAPARPELARVFVPLLEDAAGRLVRAEVQNLRKKLQLHLDGKWGEERVDRGRVWTIEKPAMLRAFEERNTETLQIDLEDFYGESSDFHALATRILGPPVTALVRASFDRAAAEGTKAPDRNGLEAFVAGMVAAVVARYSIASRKGLVSIAQGETDESAAKALGDLFEKWIEERPGRVAARESVQSSRAAAVEAFRRSGVETKRWVTRGADCGFCAALDGETVAIGGIFVEAGQTIVGTDGRAMTPSARIGHAPLHRGCDCDVVPGN